MNDKFMKKIFENISERTIRIAFTLLVLAVLSISLFNFMNVMYYKTTSNDQCAWFPLQKDPGRLLIADVLPGGVADQAGIKNGDILVKINGKPFKNSGVAMVVINQIPFREYATYTIERNGNIFDTKIQILKVFDTNFFASFLLGLGFLIVGYIVLMTKPKGKTQQRFGFYSVLLMSYVGLANLNVRPGQDPLWQIILLIAAFTLSRIFGPPLFVIFFFYFPTTKNIKYRKTIKVVLYSISTLWIAILYFINFKAVQVQIPRVFFQLLDTFIVIGFILFVHSYFKRIDKQRRKELLPILISILFVILIFLYTQIVVAANPFAIFLNPSLLLPALLYIGVPIAFGYSIFKYRLMDTELIIKKSLIYGIITAAIAAIYLLFIFGVGNLLGFILGQADNQAMTILAFLIIAFAFDPFKQKLQVWIDRIFYQARYNYQKVLLEFSKELPRQINLEQILNSLVNRISNTMHVDKISVTLCDELEGCYCVAQNMPEDSCKFIYSSDGLLSLLKTSKSAQSFALLGKDPEIFKINSEDKEKLKEAGIVLVVPMFLQDRLIGIINAGAKLSGKIYSQEDIDLLLTVASQAAIAIENARLHLSEVKRQLMEEELSLARKIQEGLLPKENPTLPGLDISGISIPALSVGGDYFDYIQINPNKLLIVVADVSGKGMSAALYMSKIQGMVQLAAHMFESPKDILIEVNKRIYDNIERKSFITMILALFELDKNTVKICRAGHNKPLIKTNGKFEFIGSDGIGLGLEKGPVFESHLEEFELTINKNSMFIFYSDGLNEAMDIDALEFGEDKIYDIVTKNEQLPAQALQNIITSAIKVHRGSAEQNDDLTLVIVKSN
jgi:phosphoserine phosphatase RsbU/P